MSSFQDTYLEIRELVGDSSQELCSEELLKQIHKDAQKHQWSLDSTNKYSLSLEKANEERDKGTKLFRTNQLQEACDVYTNYLRMCHCLDKDVNAEDKSRLTHQGYANRSAVLFRANKYYLCLDDIEAALHYSSKPKTEYLIYDRRARCCLFLMKWREAKKAFNDAMEAVDTIESLHIDVKEAFQAQIATNLRKIPSDAMLEEGKDFVDEDMVMEDEDFLIKLAKKHENHVGLSTKIKVLYNEAKGRHVIANEIIKAGEVIAVENANVSFTHYDNEANESKACHHCVNALNVNRHPSPVLDGIYFCSWKCTALALNSYHKYETFVLKDYIETMNSTEGSNDKIERSGCMFLALRAVAAKPLAFYCNNSRSDLFLKTEPSFGLDKDATNLDQDELKMKYLFNLVTHEKLISSEERIKAAIRSIIVLQTLRESNYFEGVQYGGSDDLSTGELVIVGLLYRLQLGVTNNVHLIYRLMGDISGGIPLDMVGSAIYHDSVLLNHSCAANTTRFYQGGQMVLIAKRSIVAGEEVYNNYGAHHNNMNSAKRQLSLKNGYKFTCDCSACQDDYPLLNKIESALPSKKVGKDLETLIAQYQRLFAEGCLEEARDRCCDYIIKLEQSGVKYPHRSYEIGAIAMNSCWWGIISRQSQMIRPNEKET